MEQITNDNYYNQENAVKYMSASQFKDFIKCPACALAKIHGEYVQESTKSLLMGSYIDAHFSNEMDDFKKNHSAEMFTSKGELKSDFVQCNEIIKFIEQDEMMMKYLSGEHQVIIQGTIAGVPFRGKMDSYFPGKLIVDQKVMKDMEPVWNEKTHCKENFAVAWGYIYQACIYRELVRQSTIGEEHPDGLTLPFVLAVTTKEKTPKKALIQIDPEDLDEALEFVKEMAPIFQQMKEGKIPVERCEDCEYCRQTAKITGIKSYHMFDPS